MSSASCVRSCFDPVADLPGELAAICLSFLGPPAVLGVAQHVSRTWRNAIDGSLPAVWHDVNLEHINLTDALLTEVVRKSHGAVMTLKFCRSTTTVDADHICSLHNLRILHLDLTALFYKETFSLVLPSFPLLEDLEVRGCCAFDVVLPPLHFLTRMYCSSSRSLTNLHNLPSLNNLYVFQCSVDASEPWPASLRDVTILNHRAYDQRVVERIAGLPHLVSLDTDWSFLPADYQAIFFAPPYDQLSFLANIVTLEKFSIYPHIIVHHTVLFPYLGAMSSLRDLRMQYARTTDQDLQVLSQLTHLHTLNLSLLNTITSESIRVIACVVPNLTNLTIKYCPYIADYSPVGLCSQLTSLEIVDDGNRLLAISEQRAIAQLPLLKSLVLCMRMRDTIDMSAICTLRSLRKLDVINVAYNTLPVSAQTISLLSAISSLEYIRIHTVKAKDLPVLVDILVQMPKLRVISMGSNFSAQDKKRLRDALPRLEKL